MSGLEMKYFVLKPRGTDAYALASRCAMREYSAIIATENPALAMGLEGWADKEARAADEADK